MNVKPGDLAIIIGAKVPDHEDVLGRIVNVVGPGPQFGTWEVTFVGDRPKSLNPRGAVWGPDADLRPISGLSDQANSLQSVIERAEKV
jgi:hypothetical protein